MSSKEGQENLDVGPYPVKLEFFERVGRAGMIFRYSGADSEDNLVVVPSSALRDRTSMAQRPRGGLKEEVFFFSQGKSLGNLKCSLMETLSVTPQTVFPLQTFWRIR